MDTRFMNDDVYDEEELEMNPRYAPTMIRWIDVIEPDPWRDVDLRNALFEWAVEERPGEWYVERYDNYIFTDRTTLTEALVDTVQGDFDAILDEETLDRAAIALELADPDVLTQDDVSHMLQAAFFGKVWA